MEQKGLCCTILQHTREHLSSHETWEETCKRQHAAFGWHASCWLAPQAGGRHCALPLEAGRLIPAPLPPSLPFFLLPLPSYLNVKMGGRNRDRMGPCPPSSSSPLSIGLGLGHGSAGLHAPAATLLHACAAALPGLLCHHATALCCHAACHAMPAFLRPGEKNWNLAWVGDSVRQAGEWRGRQGRSSRLLHASCTGASLSVSPLPVTVAILISSISSSSSPVISIPNIFLENSIFCLFAL